MGALRKKGKWLKKYTKLKYLEGILEESSLFLGEPDSWPDKNDGEAMKLYKVGKKIQSIRATCLNMGADRYHFWEVYGGREHGVCLWFDSSLLLRDIKDDATLSHRAVHYRFSSEGRDLKLSDLPFLKRQQYSDEREYRVVRECCVAQSCSGKLKFSPKSLVRIYLNPWLDDVEVANYSNVIHSNDEFRTVQVLQNNSLLHGGWVSGLKRVAIRR